MPSLIFTPAAVAGLERCRLFLKNRGTDDPDGVAASRNVIKEAFERLREGVAATSPDRQDPAFRLLVISFRSTGYLAQVRYNRIDDLIVVTNFRHQREQHF